MNSVPFLDLAAMHAELMPELNLCLEPCGIDVGLYRRRADRAF